MKKALSLLLAIALFSSLACSAYAQQSPSYIADRTIVGRAFVDDVGSSLPDNQLESVVARYMKEQTGISFYWEYTSGNNDLEVLTTMLAVGDIPDLILSYCDNSGRPEFSVLRQAIQAGMFLNLEPYLKNTKVLSKYLDDSWLPLDTAQNVDRNAEYPDDGIYMLHMRIERYPGARGRDDLALYMNMDAAQAAGISPGDITDTASLIAAAETILAKELKDKNGKNVVPIGPSVWGGRMQSEYFLSAAISRGRETLYGVVDGQVKHISGTELLAQSVSYVREALAKKLIDPEVFSMVSARAQEAFINGHYAFMIMNANQANNKYFDTGIEWLPCYNMTDRDGSRALGCPFKSGYMILAVNAETENPQEVVDFLDYLCSREGKLAWNYGVEGVHYDLNEEGQPVMRQEWLDLLANDASKAMQEGVAALGSDWGYAGNTDMAPYDDFGEYALNDRQNLEKAEHKLYMQNYLEPEVDYYDGVSAAAFFYQLPENVQMKLEQFVDPKYHADIFVKACFAESDDAAAKILADYRNLLEKQGICEMESLLQKIYEEDPASIHFN